MPFFRHTVSGIIIVLCALFFTPLHLTAAEPGDYIAIRKEGSGKLALVLNKPDGAGKKRVTGLRVSIPLYAMVLILPEFSH